MLPSRYFIDLTQPEIAAQLKKNPLVILPAGSVEQHGPHLPTGTDIFASNVIGHAVAERMDGLVLPATPFGVTPMHMPFEGTITLHARHLHARGDRDLRLDRQARRQVPADPQLARGQHPLARHRRGIAASRPRHDGADRAGLLRRRGTVRPFLQRPHPRRRDRGAGRARLPARPRASRPHRLFVRPHATATRWTSCGARAAISRC